MKNMQNRLLVCTQEMNKKSSTLGFMHAWATKLSAKYDSVIVICLYSGEYNLPENVKVISLGKEHLGNKRFAKLKYALNFYKGIFSERNNYDKVFVHMNDEYVVLGGIFWKLLGKKVVLWSNHHYGTWIRVLGTKFVDKVFYTSKFSYTADKSKFPQGMQMPVGVDVESLNTKEEFVVPNNSILSLGRLDPSKKPEIILKALKKLQDQDFKFTCEFVGGTSADKFPNYENEIKKLKQDLGLGDNVRFVGAVPNTETYKYYLSHDIYLNVAKSGMLDKTIFKALAAGCLPLTTSIDFNEMIFPVVGDEFKVEQDSVDSLAEKLKHVLAFDPEHKKHKVKLMQDVVIQKHSLDSLMDRIFKEV